MDIVEQWDAAIAGAGVEAKQKRGRVPQPADTLPPPAVDVLSADRIARLARPLWLILTRITGTDPVTDAEAKDWAEAAAPAAAKYLGPYLQHNAEIALLLAGTLALTGPRIVVYVEHRRTAEPQKVSVSVTPHA